MKIYLVVLLFSFYSRTSAWWWDTVETFDDDTTTTTPGPTTVYSRDCLWMPWTEESCLQEPGQDGDKPKYSRIARRKKIPAVGLGKNCVGAPGKVVDCTFDEYYANLYVSTVTAALNGGGGTTSRSDGDDDTETKCITHDIKDADGNVVASGRKCPKGTRKRRRVVNEHEPMQRRFKRQASSRPPPPVLSVKNRDVLFLLDESGSVNPSNFKLILKMARTLVDNFCDHIRVGKDTTRVGVLSFNLEQHPQINFTDFLNKASLVTAIDNDVKYYGSPSDWGTCLVEALDYTRNKMFNPALTGARIPDPNTNERLVILITDGCANCGNGNLIANLQSIGEKFKKEKIAIVQFVVAEKPSGCFDIMKGLAVGSHCVQQFSRKNWADFSSLIDVMEKVGCMNYWSIGPSC